MNQLNDPRKSRKRWRMLTVIDLAGKQQRGLGEIGSEPDNLKGPITVTDQDPGYIGSREQMTAIHALCLSLIARILYHIPRETIQIT